MVVVRAMEVEDIIIDILSWLPVRSLLRFRCVCKSWRALICSPDFIAKHLRRAATKKVLVSNVPSPLFPQLLDYKSLTTDSQSHNAVDGGYEFPDGFNDLSFLGSCNGLVCLKGKYVGFYGVNRVFRLFNENTRVLLWNPSTREIRKLPDIDVFKFGPLFYGFGYDSAAQDYKVVLGGWDDEDSGDSLGLHMVAIFSLKTGSWKMEDY